MTGDEREPAAGGGARLSIAFCPSAPLLLPALAGRAVEATAELRSACTEAVAAVLATGPEVVVVVGAAPGAVPDVRYGAGDVGTSRGFGGTDDVPFEAAVRPDGRSLPLAHTVGAWLLREAGCTAARWGVAPDGLSAALSARPGTTAVLVVGDGSARRTLGAPGYLDTAAGPFDAAVAAALAAGDAAALAALDRQEGERLLADGVPAWQAVGRAVAGRPVAATLRYDDAPFGVGYLVADWAVG